MNIKRLIVILIIVLFTSIAAVPFDVKTIESYDGTKISYILEGSGKPVLVFIHGWSSEKTYWEYQLNEFSTIYTVVAIDLAGHGESEIKRDNYTIPSFGKDVAAVIKANNLTNIILVGHSMGGAVAIEAAKLLGNNVIGIIGADTFHDLNAKFTEEQKLQYIAPFKENFRGNCKAFAESMFPPDADSSLVEAVAMDMSTAPEKVAISSFENLLDYNPAPSLNSISIPFIAINSTFLPTNTAGNSMVTDSFTVKTMEGVGHFVMMEDPVTFNMLLKESISEINH
jgi:pimeloyl-ACP methyl ester carboxylesterase